MNMIVDYGMYAISCKIKSRTTKVSHSSNIVIRRWAVICSGTSQ